MIKDVESVKLGQIATIDNGFAFKSGEYVNSGLRIIRITNVQDGYIEDNDPKFIAELRSTEFKNFLLHEGDILMSLTGNVGRVGMIQKNLLPAALNQRVARINPKLEAVLPKYLFYFLNSQKTRERIINLSAGIAQLNASTEKIKNISIPLPSIESQHSIVSVLDALSDLRKRRAEADKKMTTFASALFYEMFGDPEKNEKEWEVKKLGDIVLPVKSATPSKVFEGKFTYVDITAIDNNNGRIRDPKLLAVEDAPSRARQLINLGDVLVSLVRPNLKGTALVNRVYPNGICSTGFCVLRPNSSLVTGDYLYGLTRQDWFSESLLKLVKGATYPAVTDKQIKNLDVQVPPLVQQKLFADRIAEASALQEKQSKSKKGLEEIFKGFMIELL